jgi:uncharacterized protein YggE
LSIRFLAALPLIALLSAGPVFAQEPPQTATLTADGVGTVFTVPDIVIIDIGVTTQDAEPADALAGNDAAMQAVINAIIAAGVAEIDIATSGFSISPVYAPQRSGEIAPPPIVAYEVTNQVTVKIRDLANSGAVLNQVVAAGANRINSIRFEVDEPKAQQDEATQLAIADAMRRAQMMAEAAGVRIVRVLTVSSYLGGGPQPMMMERSFAAANQAVPVMAGERAITANATVTFEIAPR